MNALVVGGTGTTGPYIVEGLLHRDYDVTILHRGVHEAETPAGVQHLHCDPHWLESLKAAMEGMSFDLVVAAYGRLAVVAEAIKGKTTRVISMGGAHPIYKGWSRVTERNPYQWMEESRVPISEDDPIASAVGVDHFSERVREAELLLMKAHQEGCYNATHIRIPFVYGPRQIVPAEWSIIRRIRDGRKRVIVPGGGMALLSRAFEQNIAHAVMLAVDNPTASAGQIYNVRDERTVSNREWLDTIAKSMNCELEKIAIPSSLLPRDFFNAPPQLLSQYHQVLDITKIKAQLGYSDLVPAETALDLTVRWRMDNPVPPGGEIESNLADPFDYEVEDRIIDAWKAAEENIRQELSLLPRTAATWRHPYAHPQKPGDVR